jgi:capsular exopolysaccharide synthesis family protein
MAVVANHRSLQGAERLVRPHTTPWRSLRRRIARRRSFVLAGLLATVVTALTLSLLHDDRYRAESSILLLRTPIDELLEPEPPAATDDAGTDDASADADADATRRRIANEIAIIEGAEVRTFAFTLLGIAGGPPVQVSSDPDRDVLVVAVDAHTAPLAADLANAYVGAYIALGSQANLRSAGVAATELQQVIDGLERDIADIDRQLGSAEPVVAEALAADRVDLAADLAESVDRLRRVELEAALGLPPAQVLETAVPPASPVAPDRLAVLIAALVAGLALGLVAAFVADAVDTGLHDVDRLRRLPGVGPVLAAVPVDPSAPTPPLALVRSSDPAAVAYRTLRNHLVALDHTCQVVAVTGVRTGGGASTTAANLAVAFAETGGRVIVVDADLRTPTIHRIFGVDGSIGLVDALAGESLELAVLPLDRRIDVLAGGSPSPDPAALLAASSFAALLAELRHRYTHVVIDTPALDTGTDADVVSASVDAVVVTVDLQRDVAGDTQRAVTALAHTGAPVAGLVANRARSTR